MILDFRVVSHLLGLLVLVLSALILAVGGFAGIDHLLGNQPDTADFKALLLASLGGAVLGLALLFAGRRPGGFLGQREALLLVALSWLIGAAVGAWPYRFWAGMRPDAGAVAHSFDSYINCYFESISGLTTTGATVITDIDGENPITISNHPHHDLWPHWSPDGKLLAWCRHDLGDPRTAWEVVVCDLETMETRVVATMPRGHQITSVQFRPVITDGAPAD